MLYAVYTLVLRKIRCLKNKFFGRNYKKYIIKFEEVEGKIKICNSLNEYRYINNSVVNKVKLMEIIKDHKEEINNKIEYYYNKREDYKIIFLANEIALLILGCIFLFSFFIGDTIFFLMSLFILSIYLLIFINYSYRILLLREEVKRLESLYEEEYSYVFFENLKKLIVDIKVNMNVFKSNRIMKNSINFK